MNPSEEEIKEAINNSGYLFEQEIATILEYNSFHVLTNVAFKDEDEEKSREIDVTGYKRVYHSEERKISVGIRILCECKNNTNPFVFICRNKNGIDERYFPPNFNFPVDEYRIPMEGKPNTFEIRPAFNFFKLNTCFPYSLAESKAVQFCKIVRKGKVWEALHDGIYDNILIPVIKCLEYFKNNDKPPKNIEWKYFTIYYPIVVLNSKIYSINSHSKPIDLKEVKYISFLRDIHSRKIKGKYLVDFVNKENLQEYIETTLLRFAEDFTTKVTTMVN